MFVLRTVLSVVHLVVLLLLFGTKLNAFFPPEWFGGVNLLSLSFPFFLILHFILSVFWLISFRKRAIVFLLAWVFLLPSIQSWVNYSSPKNQIPDFKMISFNTKGVSEEKAGFLNGQEVDILLLQESGWGQKDKMNLGNFKHQAQSEIMSVYSKFPIEKFEKITLIENGYALYADINVKGQMLRFVNVYLEPFQLDKTMVKPSKSVEVNEMKMKSLVSRLIPVFKTHQNQIEEIKSVIENSPYPVVLAGDFNAVPNSYEYYQLREDLEDAFIVAGTGSGTSFHDYKIPLRIDYIFASKELKPLNYHIDRSIKLSDHYPVYAEFGIK